VVPANVQLVLASNSAPNVMTWNEPDSTRGREVK